MACAKANRKRKEKRNAKPARQPERYENLTGPRYFRLIEEQLQHLHNQPVHGNRNLFLDQLVVAHLLAFFNPQVKGLRTIEDAFEYPKVRKKYATGRMPKSTVSDAQRVFDPDLLLPLIESLVERAGIQAHDRRLDELTRKLLAVDGSFFAVAPRIAWALYNQSKKRGIRKGQVRLHIEFDVLKGVPETATLTAGKVREGPVLREHLKKDCLYVLDRGFQAYSLLKEIIDAESDVVVRWRKGLVYETERILPLTDEDVDAGVVSDRLAAVGSAPEKHGLGTMRLVQVEFVDRRGQTKTMLLLTNLTSLPAWMIGLIYRHRWQVELFFRWLKCSADFDHFFSESESGMTLQVYVMMIGLLLIAVETQCRPSRYDYAVMSMVLNGTMDDLDEALAIAARRRRERQRAYARQRQKKQG